VIISVTDVTSSYALLEKRFLFTEKPATIIIIKPNNNFKTNPYYISILIM